MCINSIFSSSVVSLWFWPNSQWFFSTLLGSTFPFDLWSLIPIYLSEAHNSFSKLHVGSQIPVAETPAGKTSKPDQFTDHFSFTVVCVPSILAFECGHWEVTMLYIRKQEGLYQTCPPLLPPITYFAVCSKCLLQTCIQPGKVYSVLKTIPWF